jgi:23S rRNA (cytosine1962-C5)-methyltransferase
LKFWVHLGDYLDTGLFLDHRLTRAEVRDNAAGRQFLNLFAYTGSFTVYAAAGRAASTCSVDLSRKYLDWTERNLSLNGLTSSRHQLIHADALEWILEAHSEKRRYDLILLDPPSFSMSKRMAVRFDVQRDHPRLLADVAQLLAPGGTLYFSTPFQQFEPHFPALTDISFEEITERTLPPDFRQKGIHRCWRFDKLAPQVTPRI